jgi:hypothetical protein
MSNDRAKFLNSRRRHKTDVAIARQVKIAKSNLSHNNTLTKEPHRLAKHHAMDCGTPGCSMCGNPRRNEWMKKERRTAQERRAMQDVEATRDTHSNGLKDGDNE